MQNAELDLACIQDQSEHAEIEEERNANVPRHAPAASTTASPSGQPHVLQHQKAPDGKSGNRVKKKPGKHPQHTCAAAMLAVLLAKLRQHIGCKLEPDAGYSLVFIFARMNENATEDEPLVIASDIASWMISYRFYSQLTVAEGELGGTCFRLQIPLSFKHTLRATEEIHDEILRNPCQGQGCTLEAGVRNLWHHRDKQLTH